MDFTIQVSLRKETDVLNKNSAKAAVFLKGKVKIKLMGEIFLSSYKAGVYGLCEKLMLTWVECTYFLMKK